ncbi:MAG: iron ABC transporter permease [Gammaproteobacteria bacterium]|nr:iron ABC transporter permease [Gammaproteobacteria bacterium]
MLSVPPAIASRSDRRYAMGLLFLSALLALLVLASLFFGAVSLPAGDLFTGLVSRQASSLESALVWQLRLPRTLLAVLVGLQFATAGLILQAVIRNPLADPGVIGVSSGAGLAVVALLLVSDMAGADPLIGTNQPSMMAWLPVAALFGGLAAASLVLAMSWRAKLCPIRLTLNGVAVGAVLNALVMWTIIVWGGARTEIALIWLAGSLYGRDFLHLQVLWPWCLVGILGTLALLRPLSLLRLDDAVSASLGMRGLFWRVTAIIVAVILAASAVAVTGPIGFVGLVTPHLSRLLAGPDERSLIVVNMMVGSILMLSADLLGRSLISPLEIPAGALTTLLGIPVFLLLLHRQRRLGI